MPDAPAPTAANFSELIAHNMSQPADVPKTSEKTVEQPKPKAKPVIDHGDRLSDTSEADPVSSEGDSDGLRALSEYDEATKVADNSEEEQEDTSEESEEVSEDTDDTGKMFGMTPKELLAAFKKGEAPKEFLKNFKVNAKVDGEEVQISLEEAVAGYQRTSNYTRAKQELKAREKNVEERVGMMRDMINGWDNGQNLLSGLKRLGKFQQFHDAAVIYGKTKFEEDKLRKENPAAFEARLELQKEREAREELEQQMRRKPDTSQQEAVEEYAEQLKKLVFPTLARHGVKDTPIARKFFKENFDALWEDDSDIKEVIEEAARATAEMLSSAAKEHQAKAKPEEKKVPPVVGNKTAPTTAAKKTISKKSMSVSDMADFLNRNK